MDKELSVAPLLVNHQPKPNPTSWVKIFIYEPAEAEVLALRGRMYAVLSVSSTVQVDFTPIMQLILEELHTNYFQQTAGGILQSLETTLDGIHKKLLLMGQQDKRLSAGFSFNLLTAVNWGTVLYFGQLGASRAALLRKGTLYDIDEGQTKTTDLYLSSGLLMPHDRIILGTSQFFDQFQRDQLKDCLGTDINDLAKQLESHLSQDQNKLMQSAIVLDVDIKQVPSYEEEALQVKDPATLIDSAAAQSAKAKLAQTKSGLAQLPSRCWHWRIFGRVPGLPLVVGILIALALVASIYWNVSDSGKTAGATDMQPLVTQIVSQLDQARQVASVNPDRAQDFLHQAEEQINQGLATSPNHPEIVVLRQQHQQLQDQLNLAKPFEEVATVASPNATPSQPKLVVQSGQIWMVDAATGKLLAISADGSVQTKSGNISQLSHPLITSTETGLVAVAGAKSYSLSPDGNTSNPANLPSSVKPLSATGFRQNAYLLDGVGQVFRLPPNGANPTTYFRQPIDGSSLLDVAVDGSVYLLRQQGQLDVYFNGAKQNVSLERSSLAQSARAILAHESRGNLYLVTDASVSVWSKEGKYQGQYYLPNKPQLQMVGIDFASSTIYILAEGKLLKARLP